MGEPSNLQDAQAEAAEATAAAAAVDAGVRSLVDGLPHERSTETS